MNERHYCVYCHTLRSDGRRYIGYTGSDPEVRWKKGWGYYKSRFGRAIKKYGWDAFDHQILKDNLTIEEAKQEEIRLIALYDTTKYDSGFNITMGGESRSGYRPDPQALEKMRLAHMGKRASDETKKKRSASLKKYYSAHGALMRSEEHMRKLQEGRRAAPPWRFSHPCSEEKKSKLRIANLGKKASADTRKKMKESAEKRPVIAFDLYGNIVAIYPGCRAAAEILGISASGHIVECCQGKRKTCNNLKWKYYE